MAEPESKRLSGLIEYYIAKHLAGRKLQGVYFFTDYSAALSYSQSNL